MNEGTGLLHSIEMSNILNWNYENNHDFDRNIRNNSVLFTLIAQIGLYPCCFVFTIYFIYAIQTTAYSNLNGTQQYVLLASFHACVFILSGSKVLSVFRETVSSRAI